MGVKRVIVQAYLIFTALINLNRTKFSWHKYLMKLRYPTSTYTSDLYTANSHKPAMLPYQKHFDSSHTADTRKLTLVQCIAVVGAHMGVLSGNIQLINTQVIVCGNIRKCVIQWVEKELKFA